MPESPMTRRRIARRAALVLTAALAACTSKDGGPPLARGPGLQAAQLSPADQAAVGAAAVRAAFEIQPSLSLLVDPQYLPRTAGRADGPPVPPPVIARLRELGVVRGTCKPPRDAPKVVPSCEAEMPGYVIRFSEVLRRGGDSVQVYLAATQYRRGASDKVQVLTFERAYQMVKSGNGWRVASEARLPNRP